MRLFLVSGTSGSGKSIVLHALEDLGFYCIDNLPVNLLPAFAEEMVRVDHHPYQDAAIGIDARNLANDLAQFAEIADGLRARDLDCKILFLDAEDVTLLKRFSETRRRHPLTRARIPLAEAIRRERALLEPISLRADLRIDTSHTNVHQLRDLIHARIGPDGAEQMSLLFKSFGFKHGVPVDADFVFDVRCLANPHWEPRLRALTGRDDEVIEFLQNQPHVDPMFESIKTFLETWLPRFEAENRSYMTIAIGCTGGQHRSVYFVERLARHFTSGSTRALSQHRELS